MSRFGSVFLLGDSYTTFLGSIPEGYADWYREGGHPDTDVVSEDQTWWRILLNNTGDTLVMNNSWSGSTIGYRGYNGGDCKLSSFVYRMETLIGEGFFRDNHVDTIFVFGGTNDSWAGVEPGKMMFSDWKEADLYFVLPAICRLFAVIAEKLPGVRTICVVNSDLSPAVSVGLCDAAEHFGAEVVKLENIDKIAGHPSVAGMKGIADQIQKSLK